MSQLLPTAQYGEENEIWPKPSLHKMTLMWTEYFGTIVHDVNEKWEAGDSTHNYIQNEDGSF